MTPLVLAALLAAQVPRCDETLTPRECEIYVWGKGWEAKAREEHIEHLAVVEKLAIRTKTPTVSAAVRILEKAPESDDTKLWVGFGGGIAVSVGFFLLEHFLGH